MTAAMIGHWFSLPEPAAEYAEKQRKKFAGQQFTILESDGGYLVVSDKQLKAIQDREHARRNPKLL